MISLLTWIIPLIVLAIGTVASLYQIRMSALTNAMITWNNDFRDTLSRFISLLAITRENVINYLELDDKKSNKPFLLTFPDKILPLENEYHKLLLYLDPKNSLHIKMLLELGRVNDKLNELVADEKDVDFGENERELVALGREIIKNNWKSTKKVFKLITPPS